MVVWDIGMATGACLNVDASVNTVLAKVQVCTSGFTCSNGLMIPEPVAVDVLKATAVVVVIYRMISMMPDNNVSSTPL